MNRSVLAAAVALAVASPAAASAGPAPSAEIASCTAAAAGSNDARIAIKNTSANRGVRWVARWVHTDPDEPSTRTTRSSGTVTSGDRVIQLRYASDDLVKFVAKSGGRVLLSVRLDTADGCGVTSAG